MDVGTCLHGETGAAWNCLVGPHPGVRRRAPAALGSGDDPVDQSLGIGGPSADRGDDLDDREAQVPTKSPPLARKYGHWWCIRSAGPAVKWS